MNGSLDDYWRWRFEASAGHEWWHHSATTLLASAKFLWAEVGAANREMFGLIQAGTVEENQEVVGVLSDRGRHGLPALLLGGYALENLLKAIRLRQGAVRAIVNGTLSEYFAKHDLLRYAEDAGVGLDAGEKNLLIRLEQAVVWAGKYPIPKEPHPKELRKHGHSPSRVTTSGDAEEVVALYRRLEKVYQRLE